MARPRTWGEVRRRVLEEDYYDLAELERRRRKAQQMKYGGILVAPALVLLVPQVIFEGVPWLMLLAIGLMAYSGISLYVMGRIFERRWDELIREKSLLND